MLKSLEAARAEKLIGAPLEARVRIATGGDTLRLLRQYEKELAGLFIVSQVVLEEGGSEDLKVTVERAAGTKCERCWKYTEDIGSDPQLPTVCAACSAAIRENLNG